MGWIFLTGIDKINKKKVSDFFCKKGYTSIDIPIPNKKYLKIDYSGPTYENELLDLYLKYDGQDIVWNRTPHEEHMWSTIYNTKILIPKEELDEFVGIGEQNNAVYYLVQDDDLTEQWKRCLEANEITSKEDYKTARILFENMASEFGFIKISNVDDFIKTKTTEKKPVVKKTITKIEDIKPTLAEHIEAENEEYILLKTPEQVRLEKANAISSLLDKRILKKTGEHYDNIENEVREFLNGKLSTLLGISSESIPTQGLSFEEIHLIKIWLKAFKEKMKK